MDQANQTSPYSLPGLSVEVLSNIVAHLSPKDSEALTLASRAMANRNPQAVQIIAHRAIHFFVTDLTTSLAAYPQIKSALSLITWNYDDATLQMLKTTLVITKLLIVNILKQLPEQVMSEINLTAKKLPPFFDDLESLVKDKKFYHSHPLTSILRDLIANGDKERALRAIDVFVPFNFINEFVADLGRLLAQSKKVELAMELIDLYIKGKSWRMHAVNKIFLVLIESGEIDDLERALKVVDQAAINGSSIFEIPDMIPNLAGVIKKQKGEKIIAIAEQLTNLHTRAYFLQAAAMSYAAVNKQFIEAVKLAKHIATLAGSKKFSSLCGPIYQAVIDHSWSLSNSEANQLAAMMPPSYTIQR